ncbi:MAG: mannosyltransferase [Allomuricauda sp.]
MLFVLGSVLFYGSFGYDLDRADYIKLWMLYCGAFYFCHKLIQQEHWNFRFLLVAGILFRLVFLFAEPTLSQDFYRFIWDGELIKNGINPYLYTPKNLIAQGNLSIAHAQELFVGMGELSAKHFSNYPPINQLLFALASLMGGGSILGSIIVMRVTLILADIGVLYFGRKLLQQLNRPAHHIFWYFLNPLVVIELSGNLHFEGAMLFFFVWSLYLMSRKKWLWAAPIYVVSIMVKLVPLLFLPIFFKYLGLRKSVLFYILVGVGCVALLLPFYASAFVDNYSETVGLWFSNFEFNAGTYNLIKKIAINYYDARPWELIKSYGSIMAKIVIVFALLIAFLRKNRTMDSMLVSMLMVLSVYYFLSSTVHPWYLTFLLGLGLFTTYRFPLAWSLLVILSYYAYSNPAYAENLWLLGIEYFLVIGFFIYELMGKHPKKLYFFKK